MGPISCPETSVLNQPTVRNILQDDRNKVNRREIVRFRMGFVTSTRTSSLLYHITVEHRTDIIANCSFVPRNSQFGCPTNFPARNVRAQRGGTPERPRHDPISWL
jgi:hypothetical protein